MTSANTAGAAGTGAQDLTTNDGLRVVLDAAGVMTVAFNRPETLNALTRDVGLALLEALETAAARARVLVLTGSERAFCSGADLSGGASSASASSEGSEAPGGAADGAARAKGVGLDVINEAIRRIRDLPIPSIAAVSGPAAGVGCSFALICDYVVMSEKSYLMLAFAKIGLMPDGGATALVAASAGRHRALRMALSAEKVYADRALEWGLASEVAAPEAYLTRALELAAGFAAGPTKALGTTELAINAATLGGLDAALDREEEGQQRLLACPDFAEGSAAFREKRAPVFTDK
ncbi:enoyl-CoA hydratase-related protein [Brevibacterium sp. BRM-1]|uniref:enoyl-CoA hydratase-related protein n=1 Tax=Brevibacterium sp. BRM-1 TaxID=2999062 RepID=UPI00227E491F|nr:enoyl-CoA hydratase-related protein [Brevibacterium sp. BRM-1]WAL40089.1 enoyl-CoA hydratase-related protein [Brevibacterium sp. BRM-1]